MDINKLSRLQIELAEGLNYSELESSSLLDLGSKLLTQYRQSKAIIRKLSVEDTPTELNHWNSIKDFTYSEIETVINEIYKRSLTDLENFGPKLSIKFADLVAKVRATCFLEIAADRKSNVKDEPGDEVVLILDLDD